MIKKSELGKLKMPVMKKKAAESAPGGEPDFAVEDEAAGDELSPEEGSPDEEAAESPEEEMGESEDMEAKLADVSDDELQAEIDRRKKMGGKY